MLNKKSSKAQSKNNRGKVQRVSTNSDSILAHNELLAPPSLVSLADDVVGKILQKLSQKKANRSNKEGKK